ncbi:MAG: hypothetical protein JWN04_2700 [Myxococcaceae bacterium]|nr:hypothetical protein [Myxococcaceae bacterium]
MRILITGFSGFVSRHFLEYLDSQGEEAVVLGVSRSKPAFTFDAYPKLRCDFRQLDLLDRPSVEAAVVGFEPTHVLHLAAYSSVGFSWQQPVESFANNTNIFLNLLEQVRKLSAPCRVLSVGSSEEYGNVEPGSLPLHEGTPVKPVSPYAVARVAQEMLSNVYVRGYGLDIVMTRSFNHIGPYQRDAFVVPSLAKQLCAIRYSGAAPRLVTGDRTVVRDFVDVRDVVRAYYVLLQKGTTGEIYNVCSGTGVSIEHVLSLMQDELGTAATLESDPRLLRPTENRSVVGSYQKLERELGWRPEINLRESVSRVLRWSKTQL